MGEREQAPGINELGVHDDSDPWEPEEFEAATMEAYETALADLETVTDERDKLAVVVAKGGHVGEVVDMLRALRDQLAFDVSGSKRPTPRGLRYHVIETMTAWREAGYPGCGEEVAA